MTVSDRAPYEILQTEWLAYSDVLTLKKTENVLEILYNSGLMKTAFDAAVKKKFDKSVSKALLFLSENEIFAEARKPRDLFEFFAKTFPDLAEETAYDYFKADLFNGNETFLSVTPDMKKAQKLLRTPEKIAAHLSPSDAEIFLGRDPKKWLRHIKVLHLSEGDTVFLHLPHPVIFRI